jgi:hypothetical protein
MKSEMEMSFAFLGDSEIESWPSEVLPAALDGWLTCLLQQ